MQEEFISGPGGTQEVEQIVQEKKKFPVKYVVEIILFIGLAVLYILFFTSKKGHEQSPTIAVKGSDGASAKVVFVNIDTLNVKYNFVRKLKTDLETTGKRLESEILSEQATLEKEAAAFQKQAAANAIPEDKARAMYEALMQKQQVLADKKEKYTQQVAEKEQAMHQTLLDTVTCFLKRYNRTYKFDYILGFANSGQILLGNESMDITSDVVKQLNQEYKEK